MMIHEITRQVPAYKARKRVGRGESSGMGKTSGRGHKGAKSRSGWSARHQYDGGQINFIQKMPKRGFSNADFRREYHIVNLKALAVLPGDVKDVNAETLAAAGIIRDASLPVKILGEGEVSRPLNVSAAKLSASAKSKIEAAGGSVKELVPTKWTRKGLVPDVHVPKPKVQPVVDAKAKGAEGGKAKGEKKAAKDGGADAAPKKDKKDKGKEQAAE